MWASTKDARVPDRLAKISTVQEQDHLDSLQIPDRPAKILDFSPRPSNFLPNIKIVYKNNKPGRSQSQMPVLSRDREEDVPECSEREISQIFLGKIWYPGNGIQEHRPLAGMGLWDGQSEI